MGSEKTVRSIIKLEQIEHFGLSKKAAVVSNFCLIGKIHHNFLVPNMIELGRKTFMPIQTLDLQSAKSAFVLYFCKHLRGLPQDPWITVLAVILKKP